MGPFLWPDCVCIPKAPTPLIFTFAHGVLIDHLCRFNSSRRIKQEVMEHEIVNIWSVRAQPGRSFATGETNWGRSWEIHLGKGLARRESTSPLDSSPQVYPEHEIDSCPLFDWSKVQSGETNPIFSMKVWPQSAQKVKSQFWHPREYWSAPKLFCLKFLRDK